MSYMDYLNALQEMASARSTMPQKSSTITSEVIDEPEAMSTRLGALSGMINAGTGVVNTGLNIANTIHGIKEDRLNRNRQTMIDSEDKRRFNENQKQTTRGQNLSAMEYLSGIRSAAGQAASRRLPFRDALATLVR